MWKYIVTWTIITIISVPCENNIDEFGRRNQQITYQLCTKNLVEEKSKEFKTRDSAFAFYKRANRETSYSDYWQVDKSFLTNIKIDSILVTP